MAEQHFTTVTGDDEAGANQMVAVPLNRKPLAPTTAERARRLRKHLVASLRGLRTMKDPVGSASPMRSAPGGFAGDVARAACTLCRGFCCKGGGEHAYLDERVMSRVRRTHPDLDARAIMRLYLDRVPAIGYEGSCVFHSSEGCTLDRALRSDVCNSYFCTGLGNFVVRAAESAQSVIIMSGEGEDIRLSPVMTR